MSDDRAETTAIASITEAIIDAIDVESAAPEELFCTMCSERVDPARGLLFDGLVSWPNGTDVVELCSVECLATQLEEWAGVVDDQRYAKWVGRDRLGWLST